MKCTPEKISGKEAEVCQFAENPNAAIRTEKLAKQGFKVTTVICPWHSKEENLPEEWK